MINSTDAGHVCLVVKLRTHIISLKRCAWASPMKGNTSDKTILTRKICYGIKRMQVKYIKAAAARIEGNLASTMVSSNATISHFSKTIVSDLALPSENIGELCEEK